MYTQMPWPMYPQTQMQTTGAAMPMGGMPGLTMPGGMPGGAMPGGMPGGAMPGAVPPPIPSGAQITPLGTAAPTPPTQEESYIENILRMNLGKVGTFYMTFENNTQWNAKIFKGVVEAAGRDHIIISDPVTGRRYLLLMLNLDYVTFDEPLVYTLPFGAGMATTRAQ